ncbi:Wall-associated receptor kinase 5 [Acorus calamus]|uniref:Wall-associated receptor kinase 5 n=1 Tax=Acorus calamus TaxID=4465 RepID=A0AAV9EL67_ACOCL|nr:Wall-associated receptor kinase 5 [Acorus calamus]
MRQFQHPLPIRHRRRLLPRRLRPRLQPYRRRPVSPLPWWHRHPSTQGTCPSQLERWASLNTLLNTATINQTTQGLVTHSGAALTPSPAPRTRSPCWAATPMPQSGNAGNLTEFLTGCYSVCENPNMVSNGSCNGIGCCQTSIPKGLKDFVIQIDSYNNYSGVIGFSPCSYAFLADRNWFTFHGLSDFSGEFYDKHNGEAPLVLEWAIGNQTCEEAQRAPNSDYACVSKNSYCYDSNNAPGYRCNCSSGL